MKHGKIFCEYLGLLFNFLSANVFNRSACMSLRLFHVDQIDCAISERQPLQEWGHARRGPAARSHRLDRMEPIAVRCGAELVEDAEPGQRIGLKHW